MTANLKPPAPEQFGLTEDRVKYFSKCRFGLSEARAMKTIGVLYACVLVLSLILERNLLIPLSRSAASLLSL